jgi:hypothetical protein
MTAGDRCEICGRPGALKQCVECGRIVCDDCYDRLNGLCMDCVRLGKMVIGNRGLSSVRLRMIAVLLIGMGVLLTYLSLGTNGGYKGTIGLPPLIFENVNLLSTFALGMILVAFILTSFLPWYVFSKRRGFGERLATISKEARLVGRSPDTMEYIITTELPRELMNSIFIEADDEEVYLLSTKDESFFRSYFVPEGFEVGEINHDYEDNYLVIKLILKKGV